MKTKKETDGCMFCAHKKLCESLQKDIEMFDKSFNYKALYTFQCPLIKKTNTYIVLGKGGKK